MNIYKFLMGTDFGGRADHYPRIFTKKWFDRFQSLDGLGRGERSYYEYEEEILKEDAIKARKEAENNYKLPEYP